MLEVVQQVIASPKNVLYFKSGHVNACFPPGQPYFITEKIRVKMGQITGLILSHLIARTWTVPQTQAQGLGPGRRYITIHQYA